MKVLSREGWLFKVDEIPPWVIRGMHLRVEHPDLDENAAATPFEVLYIDRENLEIGVLPRVK